MIRELDKEFLGRGEVKRFKFIQIEASEKGYVYRVEPPNGLPYFEIFVRKVNTMFKKVSYPGSKSFGLWAWTYPTIEQAINKLKQL